MTPKQKARLELSNYDAGVKQGIAVADSIIEQYPNGFDGAQCEANVATIKQKEAKTLTVIPKRFRDSFSAGYHIGLRSTFSAYQETLILHAVSGLK